MHKNFHIEEGTKVSASTSFPGSVSKVSGIFFLLSSDSCEGLLTVGLWKSPDPSGQRSLVKKCDFLGNISCKCLSLCRVVIQIPNGRVMLDRQDWYVLH